MLRVRHVTSVGCACVLAATAAAGPTGLFVIPVADVLGHGEASYSYSVSGNEKSVDPRYYHAHGFEVGMLNRIELGFDNDFAGSSSYNFKLLLVDDPRDGRYALSVGATGYGDEQTPGTFVVGRYNLGDHRLHAGYWQSGGNRFMAGIDGECRRLGRPLCGATYSLERVWGPDAFTTFALYFDIEQVSGLSAAIGVTVPDDRSAGVQHSVSLTYGFKF